MFLAPKYAENAGSEKESVRVVILRNSAALGARQVLIDAEIPETLVERLLENIQSLRPRGFRSNALAGPVTAEGFGGSMVRANSPTLRLGTQNKRALSVIVPSDVIAVESAGNYIHVHQCDRSRKIRELISDANQKLSRFGFVQIHRSILINPDYIEQLERIPGRGYIVTMRGGRSFPVSRGYRKHLQQCLLNPRQDRDGVVCDPGRSEQDSGTQLLRA